MSHPLRHALRLALLGVALALLAPARAADKEDGFTSLFDGKDLKGFKLVNIKEGETIKVTDGYIFVSGKPSGYFRTEKPYKNYHLKFEQRYARPKGLQDDAKFGGNSGTLIHITGADKVWPKCVEVQGMNRDLAKVFAIGGAKGKFTDDAAARKKALKPVGEWNTVEVVSKDGMLTSYINGMKIGEGSSDLTEGPIGWQSEGSEIHFRNIRIKEMK